jgi:hypothetical protein
MRSRTGKTLPAVFLYKHRALEGMLKNRLDHAFQGANPVPNSLHFVDERINVGHRSHEIDDLLIPIQLILEDLHTSLVRHLIEKKCNIVNTL